MKNLALTLILIPLAVACEFESSDSDNENEEVVIEAATDLSGEWVLSGKGKQSECKNPLDNYTYRISINGDWFVQVREDAVEQGVVTSYKLKLESAEDFIQKFKGQVSRKSVIFEFDDVGGEKLIHYYFKGNIEESGRVEGAFYAEGPGDCKTYLDASKFVLKIS